MPSIKRLHPAIVESSERLEAAGARYDASKPERSEALKWRPSSDAGLVWRYSNTPYCTDQSIDALRGKEFDDPEVRDRAAELIEALHEYRTQNATANAESGSDAALEALEALLGERGQITNRILELRPRTLRGLQALATGLVYAEWNGDIERRPNESVDDELVNMIIRAITQEPLA